MEFGNPFRFPVPAEQDNRDLLPLKLPDQIHISEECPILVDKDSSGTGVDSDNGIPRDQALLAKQLVCSLPIRFR